MRKKRSARNQTILMRAERNPSSRHGTTLVALLVSESHAWMVNVGDSRGYRLRNSGANSQFEQITIDHFAG